MWMSKARIAWVFQSCGSWGQSPWSITDGWRNINTLASLLWSGALQGVICLVFKAPPWNWARVTLPETWPDLVTLANLSSLHSSATLLPILIKHYNRNLCLQVSWGLQRILVFIFLAASSLYTHIWAHLPTSAQTHCTQSPLNSAHPTLLLTC